MTNLENTVMTSEADDTLHISSLRVGTKGDGSKATLLRALPTLVAEIGRVPLRVARFMLNEGMIDTYHTKGEPTLVVQEEVEKAILTYLSELPVPEVFQEESSEGIYTLPAWQDTEGYLHIWCRWCREFHDHGRGEGRRAPHCEWNTPYKAAGGYNLRVAGPWTPQIHSQAPTPRYPALSLKG